MNFEELRERFHQYVYPAKPNDWDIEEALHDLQDLDEDQQDMLLRAIPTIWPISHSLSFSFLKEGARFAAALDDYLLAEWLRRILSHYEEGGLKKARRYMAEVDPGHLGDEEESVAVLLNEYFSRLSSFARGISGLTLVLQPSDSVYSDTETIFLPHQVLLFSSVSRNLLFYKLQITLQTCLIRLGSLNPRRLCGDKQGKDGKNKRNSRFEAYFETFTESRLAREIYQMMEVYRAFQILKKEFNGLVRETLVLRKTLCRQRFEKTKGSEDPLESVFREILLPEEHKGSSDSHLMSLLRGWKYPHHAPGMLEKMYRYIVSIGDPPGTFSFSPLMDGFNFADAERVTRRRIVEDKKKFTLSLADFISKKGILPQEEQVNNSPLNQTDGARIVKMDGGDQERNAYPRAHMSINNNDIELPEEISALIKSIEVDVGRLPDGYVSAAFGLAGRARVSWEEEGELPSEPQEKFIPYDEWDYRRHGYRKNWCSLRQRTLPGVTSEFVQNTLGKNRGILRKIRRQFEIMRTQERFVRRRRHGDDLDLDAVIDSLGDQCAGLPPSEKLFVRLIRDERSISTVFLVDMSNSTEGWIGIVIKEALVLLCEAMESVGDRYGIFGFSGMRRMRSEVYAIKEITEEYTQAVKERIAAISPKDYTRMGPPIRHMIQYLSQAESKTRLLVILSDGKPEDYDDYKGQYAIEDTRRALAEARGRGIHPYCITIDQESHDYLEHLFGRGNYCYVKNIRQLPSRLTEIYRLLTR